MNGLFIIIILFIILVLILSSFLGGKDSSTIIKSVSLNYLIRLIIIILVFIFVL